jgi:hypothetical protein
MNKRQARRARIRAKERIASLKRAHDLWIPTGRYLGVPEDLMEKWTKMLGKQPAIPFETQSLRIMEFTERFLREHE